MILRAQSDRKGAALAVAVLALAIIGALVAGTFLAAILEQRSGDNLLSAEQAFAVAEAGLDGIAAEWNATLYDSLTPGATIGLPPIDLLPGFRYTDSLTRLNGVTFMARAWGQRLSPAGLVSRHVLARYLRLELAVPPIDAALTTLGLVTMGTPAMVDGVDSIPAGWGSYCPPPQTTRPGIRSKTGSVTIPMTCQSGPCVSGIPPVLVDSGLNANALTSFGTVSFAQLLADATIQVSGILSGIAPAVDSAGGCDLSITTNWGEPSTGGPSSACFGYFPVIAATGGTRITGGRGQGILLSDGDLEVTGGFEFIGPVVIRGRLITTGVGGRFLGGIVVLDDFGLGSSFDGSSSLVYSSCGLSRAEKGAARAVPIRERSWIDVF